MKESPTDAPAQARSYVGVALAVALCVAVGVYTVGVVSGEIPGEQQISATHLGIIALTSLLAFAILSPKHFDRLRLLELSGFKLELLEEVKENQAEQNKTLENIRLMLAILIPEVERQHLINLYHGRTSEYVGSSSQRAELRRLRSLGLIKKLGNRNIADLKDGLRFDLANVVALTTLGQQCVESLEGNE